VWEMNDQRESKRHWNMNPTISPMHYKYTSMLIRNTFNVDHSYSTFAMYVFNAEVQDFPNFNGIGSTVNFNNEIDLRIEETQKIPLLDVSL